MTDCSFLRENNFFSEFYLHWALERNYLNLIFYFWIFYCSCLELFPTPDLMDQILLYIYNRPIFLIGRVCAGGAEDQGSIPGWVIPKTQKIVLDNFLLNTQHYKVHIKGKVEHPPLHLGVVAIEKGAIESPSTSVVNFSLSLSLYIYIYMRSTIWFLN